MKRLTLTIIALSAALGAQAQAAQAQGLSVQASPAMNDYAKPANWLCWPGKSGDACSVDITATVVEADGSERSEAFRPDPKAPLDCFYVYPTVSTDPGVTSDMTVGPEELNVARQQLARFGSKCRIYAPLYRQLTLTALRAGIAGRPLPGSTDPAVRQLGYNDVAAAWNYYLEHENKGRGVVLIGHSQGAGLLTRLIAAEVDGKPAQQRLASALLLGTNLPLERGKDVGTFRSIPTCKSDSQIGCVIAYATFRDTVPPPANSRFGRTQNESTESACVNPAALAGGKGELKAYLSNSSQIASTARPPPIWVNGKPNPKTPFVKVPGLITGECVTRNGFNYLQVRVNADPADPRTDDISGDVVLPNGDVSPDWGLHLIDANLAMGNLVDIVGQQAKTWAAKR